MTEQTGNNKPNEAEGLAFPLSGNEKLIESVRDWPTITRMSHSTQLEKLVELRDALEAAGKAHTPTDDEPEALRIAELDARQAAYRKEREDWFVDHEAEPEIATNAFFRGWDAAVGGGFRRSEVVPEPSTEVLSDWFTSSHGVAVAAVKPMTDRGPSVMVDGRVISPNDVAALIEFKAQPEPSDAQHTEARTAFRNDPDSDGMTLGEAFSTGWSAALRAAGVRGAR